MNLLFSRFGGKKTKAKEIISYFPDHETYVEPFLGSGAIFLEKEPAKFSVLNDLDPVIYNIFRLTKHYGEDFDKFNQSGGFDWTPDRDRWNDYKQSIHFGTMPISEIEELFRSIYVIHHSWSGIGTSFTSNRRKNNKYMVKLGDYKETLKHSSIRMEDYLVTIKTFDGPNTFFYLDPPYQIGLEKKYYEHDNQMTLETLAETLKGLKGMFCLSLDITPTTTELFKDFVCHKINFNYNTSSNKGTRAEYLITNY